MRENDAGRGWAQEVRGSLNRVLHLFAMSLVSDSKLPTSAEDKPAVSHDNTTFSNDNKRERTGCLLAFDWIIRPWHYFDTKPRAVAYVCAGSGFYGGILFVVGSFAGCSPAVKILLAVGNLRALYSRQVLHFCNWKGGAWIPAGGKQLCWRRWSQDGV